MSKPNRRQAMKIFFEGLVQAAGTVVVATAALPGQAQASAAQEAPAADLEQRADQLAEAAGSTGEGEAGGELCSFRNAAAAFRNGGFGGGGAFRNAAVGGGGGGFRNAAVGGGGGFRNGGFANGGGGGGFRNGGFANGGGGGGFRNAGFANGGGGGGFRNGAFRNW